MKAKYLHFIDKFFIPKNAIEEFKQRVTINRDYIKYLPGFIKDTAYENLDQSGNLHFITIAVWESQEALDNAKIAVQAEYQMQGFNPGEMMERLDITMERGIYLIHP